MSAAAAAAAEAPAAKKGGGKKKLLMIIAAALVVLLAGGVGAVVYLKKQQAAAEAAADEGDDSGAASPAPKKHVDTEKPVFVPMDPFVVNLADREADRYAQIGIQLQVPDEKASEDIKAYLPAIRNNILVLLAHRTSTDLTASNGMEQLARDIRRAALKAMGYDLPADDPAAAASVAGAHGKKKKRAAAEQDYPIRSVQFSSFIIQ